eukprot:GFUD01013617.1.p1 GENE.GFUD01013617.1~~GFUD01013617.1.p1  ORF type:complete len:645 (-),score=122.53 GFUD01013617.1:213-2147(-)
MSGLINESLDGGFLASVKENKKKHKLLETNIGLIYKTLEESFTATNDVQIKLRNAMVFEANDRLVSHPYDLIGIRRQKLFEDSLKNYLKPGNNYGEKMSWTDILKEKLSQWLNLNDEGFNYQILKVIKIVTVVTVVTLVVNVTDYATDFKVLKTFWDVGYNGHLLDLKETNELSALLLLKFYPPAMFLTVVCIFSTVQILFHLPSLSYRYKVSMQMDSPRSELGLETIDPFYVVNQYNLPRSESKNESIWQMMVQWGMYFCLSWFVTWRLQLSDTAAMELQDVDKILSFGELYMSLISSVGSLTYGQYITFNICHKYRTSGKQKLIYLFSSAMSTLCNTCILLGWQTTIADYAIGYQIAEADNFGLVDEGIWIIAFLLITPFLYKYMVLPTSNSKCTAVSMNTPNFLHGMMMQCFVFSFYLGITAMVNSFLYGWGPGFDPSLPEIGFNVTGNETFKNMNPGEYTPANAYDGNPINNRLALIVFSCAGIPLTWVFAYLGLYLFFKDETCWIQFSPLLQCNHGEVTFKEKFKKTFNVQNLIKKSKSFFNDEPNVDGNWKDMNWISNENDQKNESNVNNFLMTINGEERTIMNHIQSSFHCWDDETKYDSYLKLTITCIVNIIAWYFVTVSIVLVIQKAKEISIWLS